MLNASLMSRTSPHLTAPVLPSGSPSAVLPGLNGSNGIPGDFKPMEMPSENSISNSHTAATPESSDSPNPYPNSASVQSTLEKATSVFSTSLPPGVIPGYPSVEFGHSPVGLTPSALWPSGWPQQSYYKQ
jgi:hypothetical protein